MIFYGFNSERKSEGIMIDDSDDDDDDRLPCAHEEGEDPTAL